VPVGVLGHFRTYPTAYDHGAWFDYRSPLTNIQAHIIETVTGRRFHDVLSEELWGPLGQEFDADIMLDPLGFPVVDGGMSCALRDLARLGQAYLEEGRAGDAQVLPADWVRDTREGDDECERQFKASPTLDQATKGDWSMYRNAFWVIERGEVLSGLGIHGQYCYVNRPAGVVIARLSTYPLAWNEAQSAETMRSLAAIAEHLA
jgi:CubicO group peptidase (beta-lactamase class C family)